MLFQDRVDAGGQLAELMGKYNDAHDTVVLGLPRGGVVVAYVVAKALHLPLDIICPRKIGAPYNPEFAIGAVTETGRPILHQDIVDALGIDQEYLDQAIKAETEVSRQRVKAYRQNMPPRTLQGKTVILIDDGLATGATMEAAIHSVKGSHAKRIVIGVPVAPPDTLKRLKSEVDECFCVATPSMFSAIGQFYFDFGQTTDQEVIDLLKT